MNLHEYQAKELFAKYQIPVPNGQIVNDKTQVRKAISMLAGDKWVIKAQVHAGGRGKAGGVKLVDSIADAEQMATDMLGKNLVTYQTDAKGQPVNMMLIEEVSEIERELYLSAVIDRVSQRIVVMASTEGGMDIEKVSTETPDKILKIVINPITGLLPFQVRELIFDLKLSANQGKQFGQLLGNLLTMFVENDVSLLEINPLVGTKDDQLVCLDGKVNIDGNALYRQKGLSDIRDTSQEDRRELEASQWELNYIALDGSVGCMVNGAGLAMATMDLVKLHNGNPANFLDVGGTATAERVAAALKIITSDEHVKSVLVNIFGGIVRCDLIADGIIEAVSKTKITVPLVVRLEGNNAQLGLKKLQSCGLNIIVADELTNAVKQAISASEV